MPNKMTEVIEVLHLSLGRVMVMDVGGIPYAGSIQMRKLIIVRKKALLILSGNAPTRHAHISHQKLAIFYIHIRFY